VDEEIDSLDRFINTYNLDPRAPDSYLDLAKAHEGLVTGPRYDQGSTRQALSYFQDFAILYPQHPRVGEAETGASEMRTTLAQSRISLADWYFRYRNNFTAARILYNEAITIFPDSEIAAEAREKIARVDAAEAELKANPPSQAWRYINWLWR
jgi:outer membrane protein assembly factor BamD